MALSIQELNAATQEFWEPGAQDIYYKGNAIMGLIMKNAKSWDGGTYIRQVLDYGQPLGGDFNASDTFQVQKVQTLTAAVWTPAYYYEPVTYDIDDNVFNAGVAQEIDIINTKLTKAAKHIRYNVANDIYNSTSYGSSGRKLAGLKWMINTNTYGNISPSDLSQWTAGFVNSTSQPISFSILEDGRRQCMVGDSLEDMPDMIVTTRTLFSALKMLTLPHLRLEHGKLADMGFQNIDYDGVPVISDHLCPSGHMFFLNTNYFGFRVHKDFRFKRSDWMRPPNQMVYTCQIVLVCQMICKRRDAHGYYSALTA